VYRLGRWEAIIGQERGGEDTFIKPLDIPFNRVIEDDMGFAEDQSP
jgi:hypothetical protein